MTTPKIAEDISAEILAQLSKGDPKEVRFADAVDSIYAEVFTVLKSCPKIQKTDLPSHKFGDM